MPRQKPPNPLIPRTIRLSDEEWTAFIELGGADWLRRMMRTKPRNYYEVFNNSKEAATPRAAKTFEPRTTEGVVAFHKT